MNWLQKAVSLNTLLIVGNLTIIFETGLHILTSLAHKEPGDSIYYCVSAFLVFNQWKKTQSDQIWCRQTAYAYVRQ